ncbi:MAG: hypothetical protein V3V08_10035 [Nannocystaceae bacterium]
MGFFGWWRHFWGGQETVVAASKSVSVRGLVQAIDEMPSPLSGEICVSIRYLASVPHAFGTLLGAVTRHQVECRQSRDFILRDGQGGLLVQVDAGHDVATFHAGLLARHGLDLEAREEIIREGDLVVVRGQITDIDARSPHRRAPYRAILVAEGLTRRE